jgi:hypothetical protein
MIAIPLGLRQALESGSCVLFVGAGIACHLTVDGAPIPDGRTLSNDLASTFKVDVGGVSDLSKIAQIVELRRGRTELEKYIQKRICNPEPDDTLCWICTVRWRGIFTTNYDNGIEQAYDRTPNPPQTPVRIAATSQLSSFDRRFQVPVYYLHGKLCGPDQSRIIITENDYAEFRKQRQMMFEVLKQEFATSTFLYIGYSNQDPNWKMLLEELRSEFYPTPLPPSYRVAPSTEAIDDEILKSRNVETITCNFEDFQKSAVISLAGARVPTDALKRLESSIPSDLLPAFEINPAAVARLLSSWEYVNQAPFSEQANTRAFFRGGLLPENTSILR